MIDTQSEILLVDADAVRASRIILSLRRLGFLKITHVDKREEAFQALCQTDLMLVLIDIQSEEIRGLDILTELREHGNLDWHMPLIAIADDASAEQKARAIEGGALDCLSLPSDIILLKARIQTLSARRRHVTAKRSFLQNYDYTTGLPNRYNFIKIMERLMQTYKIEKRNDQGFFVILFRFLKASEICELLGIGGGSDFINHKMEDLLQYGFRKRVIARTGDFHFATMIEASEKVDLDQLIKIWRDQLNAPIQIGDHVISSPVSIGVAFATGRERRPESVLQNAVLAATQPGARSSYALYERKKHHLAVRRVGLEAELDKAIEAEAFHLVYQPIVDVKSRKMIGAEALMRWKHPEMGLISPAEFIPLAEENGHILPLGYWALHKVMAEIEVWADEYQKGQPFPYIAVNLSGQQCHDQRLLRDIQDFLDRTNLPPNVLRIELTETALIDRPERVAALLQDLKQMDIKIALDDFGTGYSSLSYLHQFQFDVLKVDQSFVREIPVNIKNQKIVRSMITLASDLNMSILAEGVEGEAEYQYIRTMGCHYAQGYLFSKPIEASEMARMIDKIRFPFGRNAIKWHSGQKESQVAPLEIYKHEIIV